MLGVYFLTGSVILFKLGVFKLTLKSNSREVGIKVRRTTRALIACLIVGAFVLQLLEGISSRDFFSFFMGCGDISPKTDKGRWFASFWILVSVSLLSKAVRHMIEFVLVSV
ncbi:hypothetical protein RchiOBHm_Chr7g0226951 [Rosa chinensis]|uniref:Potassium channel domain-containing protein n=1 Tax=Rosa chinensis TaxID=74649 RepID=A0A2P6PEG9_ROSCH|nr:hypothetical protein RchiOBHm_Chr7g0226951 [Rosa chinensis]